MRTFLFTLTFLLMFSASSLDASGEANTPDEIESRIIKCEEGDGSSCGVVGYYYAQRANPVDFDLAMSFYTKGIGLGDPYSFAGLGEMYFYGQGIEPDYTVAAGYQETACILGNAPACGLVASMYEKGQGVAEDLQKARDLSQRACEEGNAFGCANYGRYQFNGDGGPRQETEGLKNLNLACEEAYAWSCRTLSNIYSGGLGWPMNAVLAYQYAVKGCRLDDPDSCVIAANFSWALPEEASASAQRSHLKAACALGASHGCKRLEDPELQ